MYYTAVLKVMVLLAYNGVKCKEIMEWREEGEREWDGKRERERERESE